MKTERRRTVSDLSFAISLVVVFAAVVAAGLTGVVSARENTITVTIPARTASTAGTQQDSRAPYQLTLVEAMGVPWNKSLMQPKFYVLGSHGLQSSANISVPVNTLIQVTIFSYDTPTAGAVAQSGKVTGTLGGAMEFFNGTLATGISNETMAQMMSLGKNVTSVPAGVVAHTFSVPQLGINIPVVGGSTEIAYLSFNHAGAYTWMCIVPCGPEAMATPGWMTGTLTVR